MRTNGQTDGRTSAC